MICHEGRTQMRSKWKVQRPKPQRPGIIFQIPSLGWRGGAVVVQRMPSVPSASNCDNTCQTLSARGAHQSPHTQGFDWGQSQRQSLPGTHQHYRLTEGKGALSISHLSVQCGRSESPVQPQECPAPSGNPGSPTPTRGLWEGVPGCHADSLVHSF